MSIPTSITQDASSTATSGVSYYTGTALSTSTLPSGADHVLQCVPGSTAALAGRIALVTRPLKPISQGSLYSIFEAAITVINPAAVQGMFVGLTTSTGLIEATTILKTVSGTKNTNALAANTGAIGFWMHGDTPNNFDAVYQSQFSNGALSTASSTNTNSTVNLVLSNVLTASTIGPGNPGNSFQQPVSAVGVLTSTAVVKLGLLFNAPSNQVIYTVNGYQVAAVNVNSFGFDVTNDYGAVVVLGATDGGTASTGFLIDFLAAAAKIQL
jgi:hypothetical protein